MERIVSHLLRHVEFYEARNRTLRREKFIYTYAPCIVNWVIWLIKIRSTAKAEFVEVRMELIQSAFTNTVYSMLTRIMFANSVCLLRLSD